MEEVWVVYLCMFLFLVVLYLMKQKPDDGVKKEEGSPSSSLPAPERSGSSGRPLECTEEELEASLQRLCGVLFSAEAQKKASHHDHRVPPHHSDPQLSQSRIQQEKVSHAAHQEDLVDEIEQAVQEAADTDVHVRRRTQPPASRRHHEAGQWSETSDKF